MLWDSPLASKFPRLMAHTPSKDQKRRDREIRKEEKRRARAEAKAAKAASKKGASEGDS